VRRKSCATNDPTLICDVAMVALPFRTLCCLSLLLPRICRSNQNKCLMCDIRAMSSYGYSLLPSDSDSIRLLRLLPSEDEAAPLHCELCNYSLLRPTLRTHIYEALSYVWGDPNQTLPIRVGKNQFQVTLNLHAALSRLRDHSFERIIWVDAICIDQSNNEERRQQVQLMAKIYSNAYCVIVWLGEQVVEVEGAFEIIRRAADNELAKELKEELNREAVINLLRNPWFQRIWVRKFFLDYSH
jgi:hypothetical protein